VDRKRFPRVKICGDGLTPGAVAALVEMGLGGLCDVYPRISAVRVVGGRDITESPYPRAAGAANFGLVVPRSVLDAEIATAAVRAGATFLEDASAVSALRSRNQSVTGIALQHAGTVTHVHAPVTILADGATGRL